MTDEIDWQEEWDSDGFYYCNLSVRDEDIEADWYSYPVEVVND